MLVQEQRRLTLVRELEELHTRLANSEAWRLHVALTELAQSFDTFAANDRKLRAALVGAQDPRVIMTVWDERHDERFQKFVTHIRNLFHDYLSAATALADNTTAFARRQYERTGSPFWPEYLAKVREDFAESGPSRFLRDLRNYRQHDSVVPLSAALRLDDFDTTGKALAQNIVELDLKRIRTHVKLSTISRKYLRAKGDSLALGTLVEGYSPTVYTFHTWLRERQATIQAPQFAELDHYQAQVNEISAELDKIAGQHGL